MQKMQKIEGMSENLNAHNYPVSSIPELQQKQPKNQTLIEKCMRSIIEERMSGFLINQGRRNSKQGQIQSKKSLKNSTEVPYRQSLNSYLNEKFNSKVTDISKRNLTELYKSSNVTNESKQKLKRMRNLSNASKNNRYERDDPEQENKHSFISAIQIQDKLHQVQEPQNLKQDNHKRKTRMKSDFHLPMINSRKNQNKNRKVSFTDRNTTILKSMVIKAPEQLIQNNLWRIMTDKDLYGIKKRKRRNSTMMSEILGISSKIMNSKDALPLSHVHSSKEQILSFIENLPKGLQMLCSSVFSFFEITFQNEVSMRNYSQMLENLSKMNPKGWSFLGFVFLDADKNSSITISDLFIRFRQFQGIETYQQESIKGNKAKPKNNETLKQKICELQNVKKAKQMLSSLINKLSQQLREQKTVKTYTHKFQNEDQIKYLEQAFLTNKNKSITYKELQPLFSAGNKNSNVKASQYQLVSKDLNVKYSSSYRQCFIATQHNQETRMVRQLIETSKSNLKEMKRQRNLELRKNQENQIPVKKFKNYENFVTEGYDKKIMYIVMMALGSLEIR